jgi:hypothetical protein
LDITVILRNRADMALRYGITLQGNIQVSVMELIAVQRQDIQPINYLKHW